MIRDCRQSSNLTQEQLAVQMGISRTTVTMWESGQTLPTADKLPKLAKILNCTIDDLLADPQEEVADNGGEAERVEH